MSTDAPAAGTPARGRFRSSAVDRATTADELTRMIKVIPPHRWIILAAVLLVLVATIVWACVATVPVTKTAPGYVLPEGGLRQVEASAEGVVTTFDLQIGQHVVAGQAVGTVLTQDGATVTITAPETGVIQEVDTVLHANADAGERLAVIEPVGWPLVVYAYMPTSDAGTLAIGTEVQVDFGAGIGEQYGFAKGTVVSVSSFPDTAERLSFILQDQQIVDSVRALGPTNEIVVELERSASTPSGYVWGTGDGPPTQLPAGIPATATFITGEKHPIGDVL